MKIHKEYEDFDQFPNVTTQIEIGQNRKKRDVQKVQNVNNYSDSSRSLKLDTESESTDSSVLIQRTKKRNPRQIKSNVNDTLNDADNLDDFEDTCINTVPLYYFCYYCFYV